MVHINFINKEDFLSHITKMGFEYVENKQDGCGIYGSTKIIVYIGNWAARYEIGDTNGQVYYHSAFSLINGKVSYAYSRRCMLEKKLKIV